MGKQFSILNILYDFEGEKVDYPYLIQFDDGTEITINEQELNELLRF